MRKTKIFFDASVLFAALYSAHGASRKLVELVQQEFSAGFTTQTIITELAQNLHKLQPDNPSNSTLKLDHYMVQSHLIIRQAITPAEIEPWLEQIEPKDAHVVAGAVLTQCDYLVTLDKKHLNNPIIQQRVTQIAQKIVIIAPKELLSILLAD